MTCAHPPRFLRTRPHVGDVVCQQCKRQVQVYDWDTYNALDCIPEPGKRGSLNPEPQR